MAFGPRTTGKDPLEARIVKAPLVLVSPDDEVIEVEGRLADPGSGIPEEAATIRGVSTGRARAEGGPVKAVANEPWDVLESFIHDHDS